MGPFGIYKSVDKSEVPELYFDILVTRRLIDTLVADLLPIAVIAVLLFQLIPFHRKFLQLSCRDLPTHQPKFSPVRCFFQDALPYSR